MDVVLPVVFATIAAIGNAVFALGQKQSAGAANGLLFVAALAGLAMLAALWRQELFNPFAAFGGLMIPRLALIADAVVRPGALAPREQAPEPAGGPNE